MKLECAKAVITGAASGLGLAVARRLARSGAQVALVDIQANSEAGILADNTRYIVADVTSEASVEEAIAVAAEQFGGITLAVNCAGIVRSQRVVGPDKLLSQVEFAQVIDVNLIGTFTVCRAAARVMQDNSPNDDGERGVIINTTSIAAYEGQIGQAAYAASKGGVASLTLPLAREFAHFGVRVMAIAPGLFETPMLGGLPDPVRSALAQQIPFPKRLGEPDEFAQLVCHIYQNPMLNGEVIRLDGALRMQPK